MWHKSSFWNQQKLKENVIHNTNNYLDKCWSCSNVPEAWPKWGRVYSSSAIAFGQLVVYIVISNVLWCQHRALWCPCWLCSLSASAAFRVHVLIAEQSRAFCRRHSSLHVISFCAFAQLAGHSSLRSRRHATRSAMRYITRHVTRHVVRHDIRSSSSSPSVQSSRQSSRQNSASAARRWRSRRWLCTASDSSHWTTLRMVSDRHSKGSQLFMIIFLSSAVVFLVVVVTKVQFPKWCRQVVLLVWLCFYTQAFRVLSQWPSCEVRQLINHCRIDLRRVTWRRNRSRT